MSDIFALDQRGNRELELEARMNAIDLSQVQPDTFTGFGRGTGMGIVRGGARVGQFLSMAAAAPLALYERATDQEGRFTDPYFRAVDEYATDAVDYWTPHQSEVGKAGQIIGGLGEIALPLMAGAGNPTLLIGAQEFGVATDLSRQNVDPVAAVEAGLLQGAATAVGFKLPFLGGTLGTRMVSGAGGNLITNTAAAASTRELLEAQGYEDQAAAFDPLDPASRLVDVLTGLAFGAIAHVGAPRFTPQQKAAVATAANAKHFQIDTAPGIPADLQSSVAHQDAMQAAVDALVAGEPVSPRPDVLNASFARREPTLQAEVPPELKTLDAERQAAAVAAVDEAGAVVRTEPIVPPAPDTTLAGRLKSDQELRAALVRMKGEAGWDTVGGKMLRKSQDFSSRDYNTIVGRTPWIPRADWWPGRPGGYNAKQTGAIIDKALTGGRLGPKQQEFVQYLADVFYGTHDVDAYLPHYDDLAPYGPDVTVDDAHEAAYVARAAEIDEAMVERLALQHPERADFLKAVKEFVDAQQSAVGRGSEEGAGQKAGGDLFGQDTSKEQGLADETRRRDLIRSPSKDVSLETGDPTDLFSAARNQIDFVVNAARTAAAADPTLTVPTGEVAPDGTPVVIPAAELLARSEAEIVKAEIDAEGFEVAVNCFLQSGAG